MFISSRFKGFGFMLDVDPLQADRYRQFIFEIKLFYFNFWIIKWPLSTRFPRIRRSPWCFGDDYPGGYNNGFLGRG